jgi:hypothetical protein
MVAIGSIVECVGLMLCQSADHEQPIPIRRQRAQNGRQLESGSLAGRRPVVDAGEVPRHAVRQIDEAEPLDRVRRCLRHRRQRRHHRVEERKAERRTNATKERSSRKRFPGYEHGDPCRLLAFGSGQA